MKISERDVGAGPHGLRDVETYDQSDVDGPLRVCAHESTRSSDTYILSVMYGPRERVAADAYHPGGEELEAAKEWLLNFTYLCLEGN